MLDQINTPGNESDPVVTSDELTLYFGADYDVDGGAHHISMATRANTTQPFTNAHEVTELSSTAGENPAWASDDGCTLYFESSRAGSSDIYVARRPAQ